MRGRPRRRVGVRAEPPRRGLHNFPIPMVGGSTKTQRCVVICANNGGWRLLWRGEGHKPRAVERARARARAALRVLYARTGTCRHIRVQHLTHRAEVIL